VLAHVSARLVPDLQEYALAFVVTCSVLVGLSEVADRDRAIDSRDDVTEHDRCGLASEYIAAAHAAL
jgi:hypothetical protein